MSNSRKVVWISFALFMFFQMGTSYITNVNQNNLSFLMEMKAYIPFMVYFSLTGVILFLLSFMVYQLDARKATKQITQLENDKNELKAKLFDLQEEISNSKEPKTVAVIEPRIEPAPKKEEDSSESEEKTE